MRLWMVSCIMLLTVGATGAQTERTIVVLQDGGGRDLLSFEARVQPYSAAIGPIASYYLYDHQDVVDGEGLAVTGFAFYAWREGQTAHVVTFTLVPAKGAPNRYLADME